MPTPKEILNKDGTTTYKVRFRHRGRQTSEPFRTRAQARAFCRQIELHGVAYAVAQREALDEAE